MDVDPDAQDDAKAAHIKELVKRLTRTGARYLETATFRRRVNVNGIVYSTEDTHKGNSIIGYYTVRGSDSTSIGVIQHIAVSNESTFLVVRPFLPLPAGEYDHFAAYEDFPARTYIDHKNGQNLVVLDLAWQVRSHCAVFHVPESIKVVVVSLSRF